MADRPLPIFTFLGQIWGQKLAWGMIWGDEMTHIDFMIINCIC